MKQTLPFILFLLLFSSSYGQSKFEPQILILSPCNINYDKSLEKEISEYNIELKQNSKYVELEKNSNSKEFKNLPINIKRMTESEISFVKSLDFAKQISFMSEQFLAYRFFEKFPNLLIQLSSTKSKGEINELKKISYQENLQYILNFPNVQFYKQDGISYTKLSVQLYDQNSNTMLIDTSYIGDWNNPGFEFACKDSSLNCTLSNSLSQALNNILYNIASNSPTLIKERKLSKDRGDVLITDYYKKPFDRNFMSNIIPQTDSNINSGIIYQTIVNSDKTKFVAFFLQKITSQNFKQLNDNGKDKNINIIAEKNIKDSGYFDNIPRTYAYIVKAVKYNDKWYYEKSSITYFEPQDSEDGRLQFFNNLQQWNFFKDGSTELNPDFWETSLFAKIKDLRKDPDWKKYGKTIWKTEEEENRNYIGMYEIVADQLKDKGINQTKHIIMH